MRSQIFLLSALLLLSKVALADDSWQPLFNGKDLTGWDTEMMILPDPKWDVPGLQRDANGNYTAPVGKNNDPLHVFTVTNLDGVPAIHVSGQGFGVMMTTATFTNVHIRLQVKWGDNKWSKKIGQPFDTGLLYFCHSEAGVAPTDSHKTWPRSFEFQICENEMGDLYALGTQITVPAIEAMSKTFAGSQFVERKLWRYDPAGTNTVFVQKAPISNHCVHLVDAEKPKGEWNAIDLITFNGNVIYVVNGQIVMRLYNAQRLDHGAPEPLMSGKICLQTEGGECFFRNVEVRPITEIPAEFAEKKM
jgi:hypothetical protein